MQLYDYKNSIKFLWLACFSHLVLTATNKKSENGTGPTILWICLTWFRAGKHSKPSKGPESCPEVCFYTENLDKDDSKSDFCLISTAVGKAYNLAEQLRAKEIFQQLGGTLHSSRSNLETYCYKSHLSIVRGKYWPSMTFVVTFTTYSDKLTG